MSSGPAEWREDDHRNVAIGPPRVLGEVREALGPPSELPLALLAGCLPGQDVDRLAPHLGFDAPDDATAPRKPFLRPARSLSRTASPGRPVRMAKATSSPTVTCFCNGVP